jgi:hypothetical protein
MVEIFYHRVSYIGGSRSYNSHCRWKKPTYRRIVPTFDDKSGIIKQSCRKALAPENIFESLEPTRHYLTLIPDTDKANR